MSVYLCELGTCKSGLPRSDVGGHGAVQVELLIRTAGARQGAGHRSTNLSNAGSSGLLRAEMCAIASQLATATAMRMWSPRPPHM